MGSYSGMSFVATTPDFAINDMASFLRDMVTHNLFEAEENGFEDVLEQVDYAGVLVTFDIDGNSNFPRFDCSTGESHIFGHVYRGGEEDLELMAKHVTSGEAVVVMCYEDLGMLDYYRLTPGKCTIVRKTFTVDDFK